MKSTLRVINIPFTGKSRTVVLEPGNYRFELWGASGTFNKCGAEMLKTGWGAYSSGYLSFSEKKTFHVFVGESGHVGASTFNGNDHSFYTGTFNRNGEPVPGGGATDIRLVNNEKWTDFESLKSRIIVAGGGGGGDCRSGGDAGGLESMVGFVMQTPPTKATQTQGGKPGTVNNKKGYPGEFGKGGPGLCSNNFTSCDSGGGGGGGYYGGGGSGAYSGGSGGSSYISGHPGCIAISRDSTVNNIVSLSDSHHYSDLVFHGTQMISGNETMPSPKGTPEVGHIGDGFARITRLGCVQNTCNCNRLGRISFLFISFQNLIK